MNGFDFFYKKYSVFPVQGLFLNQTDHLIFKL